MGMRSLLVADDENDGNDCDSENDGEEDCNYGTWMSGVGGVRGCFRIGGQGGEVG